MQGRKTRLANDVLTRMENAKRLTPDGRNWLTQALDPFHDTDRKLAGYPDPEGSKTLVQCVNKTLQIAAPGNYVWDCNIFTLPELNAVDPTLIGTNHPASSGVYNRSTGNESRFSDDFIYGLINVNSVPTGAPTVPNLTVAGYVVPNQQVITYPEFLVGSTRIIAMGFEVHNTTPDLYKSGAVVVYRQPQSTQIASMIEAVVRSDSSVPPISYLNSVNTMEFVSYMPPNNVSDALTYNGSRQWNAEEGCYIACQLSTEENPLQVRRNASRKFVEGPLLAAAPCFGQWSTPTQIINNATGLPTGIVGGTTNQTIQPVPWNTSGAYFTGLSPQSTLTLTVRIYFEMSPFDNNLLETMAMPSACFDPVALELYSHVSSMMPAGVKVDENAAGEFWNKVLGVLSSIAPIVGTALTPILGPAGIALGTAAGAGLKYVQSNYTDPPGRKSGNQQPFVRKGKGVKIRP